MNRPASLPDIPDFVKTTVRLQNRSRTVYKGGQGPAVIVMSEIPGITPQVAQFARSVVAAGFTVYLPQLFGTPLRPMSPAYAVQSLARVCISREFRVLAANASSPIVDWLRALARKAHRECGGPGVGAIGMCITGNFALSMMLDAPVIAPVLSQPSLPGGLTRAQRSGLHASPAELAAAHQKIEQHGARILALRFKGDPLCRSERFERLRQEFGDACETIELDNRHAKRGTGVPPHSVVTTHLIDEAGQPTQQARDRVLSFFAEHLKPTEKVRTRRKI